MKDKLVKLGLSEELAQKVVDNFGDVVDGVYVTKERFNEVNTELKKANETIKERDGQLEKLKNDNESNDDLKKTIQDLQKANKEAKEKADAELAAERKSNAIKMELIGKVHNADITMSQLKLDEIVMDENGKVKSGLKEQLASLKKTDGYLFIPEDNGSNNNNQGAQPYVKGATPKDGEGAPQGNLSAGELFAKNLAKGHNEAIKNSVESTYFGE
ncbi:MAG: phage scaffolding protein [Romboutsia timonensis]